MILVIVELVWIVVAAWAFIPVFGDPRGKLDRSMAWHFIAVTGSIGALAALLLISVLRIPVPLLLGQTVLACLGAALTWRLVLAVKARRKS